MKNNDMLNSLAECLLTRVNPVLRGIPEMISLFCFCLTLYVQMRLCICAIDHGWLMLNINSPAESVRCTSAQKHLYTIWTNNHVNLLHWRTWDL